MSNPFKLLICLLLAVMLAACAQAPDSLNLTPTAQDMPEVTAPEAAPTAAVREIRPLLATPPAFERAPGQPGAITGEVPVNLMDQILADLAQRARLEINAIQVLRSEAVVWADGSLGCPRMGEEYVQAVTPGYWIELQAGASRYDYRATESGYFRLCEDPLPVNPLQEYPSE